MRKFIKSFIMIKNRVTMNYNKNWNCFERFHSDLKKKVGSKYFSIAGTLLLFIFSQHVDDMQISRKGLTRQCRIKYVMKKSNIL